MKLKKVICWIRGHDLSWHRIPINTLMNLRRPDDKKLYKLRGVCSRCDYWTTAIPADINGPDPVAYPALAKFVQDHRR